MHQSTKKKAEIVQKMVADNYQPERQDKCKLWVYRNHVCRELPMSERTFWRYMKMKSQPPPGGTQDGQLKMEF